MPALQVLECLIDFTRLWIWVTSHGLKQDLESYASTWKGTVIGPFQQGISRATWTRAKDAQNDSKRRYALEMYPESWWIFDESCRCYSTLRGRHRQELCWTFLGLSWSPEKQWMKSWLADMDDMIMIMQTADLTYESKKPSSIVVVLLVIFCPLHHLCSLNWQSPI